MKLYFRKAGNPVINNIIAFGSQSRIPGRSAK